MPQNVGSVKDVTSKNKHRVDTLNSAKLIVLTKREPRARSFSPQSDSSPVLLFYFVFALSQFCGPDYLGAWNRLTSQSFDYPLQR